ncbi:hypothetical protein GWI33_019670 [Rhynchophorus ferrugineus]|uniref:Uncharacterized protein n=1 Tax=Rhynchophorus ferrugineus TaxID=354439 RepID=A0A834HTA2_RHYFE|nr:hypothetical protein GWI33_019670 [Rhynchophorus ferrugineus]
MTTPVDNKEATGCTSLSKYKPPSKIDTPNISERTQKSNNKSSFEALPQKSSYRNKSSRSRESLASSTESMDVEEKESLFMETIKIIKCSIK